MKRLALFLLVAAAGNLRAQTPAVTFRDVTEETRIDFRYTFGDFTYDNILESSGSGVSVLDYDGDGDLDLYMLNGTYLEDISDPKGRVFRNTPNRLYRNNGDGTFTEVAKQAGLDDTNWSMAAVTVDFDGDGDTDIYLLNYGPNRFFRNNGNGTFTDIAPQLGLIGPETLNGFTKWSVGAAFWDYDRDGDLDVMMGNFLAFDPYYLSPNKPHLMPHPSEYDGQASLLYRQEPDGTFRDVTKEKGMYYPDSKCMGLTLFDFDNDGDLDLFQGNDHQKNFLFRCEADGTFSEVAQTAGVAVNDEGGPTGSMHGSIGDADGDGLVDLLVVDLEHGTLYRNFGDGLFEDITARSGLKNVFRGKGAWAAALFDYDNDGDLDVFSANGMADFPVDQDPLADGKRRQRPFPKRRSGAEPVFSATAFARGAAVWDYDNDGDLDIIVSHIDLRATATLLRNDGGDRNHWLGITLSGKQGSASAIGAKVTLESQGRRQVRVNQWATSYLSCNDPRIHFGLGTSNAVDRLEIRWSDGMVEAYKIPAVDRYLTIVQGKGIRLQK